MGLKEPIFLYASIPCLHSSPNEVSKDYSGTTTLRFCIFKVIFKSPSHPAGTLTLCYKSKLLNTIRKHLQTSSKLTEVSQAISTFPPRSLSIYGKISKTNKPQQGRKMYNTCIAQMIFFLLVQKDSCTGSLQMPSRKLILLHTLEGGKMKINKWQNVCSRKTLWQEGAKG